jgi:hypothetical protein
MFHSAQYFPPSVPPVDVATQTAVKACPNYREAAKTLCTGAAYVAPAGALPATAIPAAAPVVPLPKVQILYKHARSMFITKEPCMLLTLPII